jgi:hypothetical protein
VRELVHEMAVQVGGEPARLGHHQGRIVDQMTFTALEFDQRNLFRRGAGRHHRDERHSEHPGEIGLTDGGRSRRRLDNSGARADPAVAQGVQEKGSGQPVLE